MYAYFGFFLFPLIFTTKEVFCFLKYSVVKLSFIKSVRLFYRVSQHVE